MILYSVWWGMCFIQQLSRHWSRNVWKSEGSISMIDSQKTFDLTIFIFLSHTLYKPYCMQQREHSVKCLNTFLYSKKRWWKSKGWGRSWRLQDTIELCWTLDTKEIWCVSLISLFPCRKDNRVVYLGPWGFKRQRTLTKIKVKSNLVS